MRWTPELRDLQWLVQRPIAHRGLHDRSAGIIENTEKAFANAIAGSYAIECDLQLTADGEAVVFHDDTLDRVTDAQGAVIKKTVKELKAVPIKGCSDRIQTLAELLEQVASRATLVIELKTHWDGDERLAERAVAVLRDYDGHHALMSFDPDLIEAVRRLSPKTVRGAVADRATHPYYDALPLRRRLELRHFSHAARTAPHFISFDWSGLPFTPVQTFRAAGGPVICWTVRSAEAARRALRFSDQVTFEGYRA